MGTSACQGEHLCGLGANSWGAMHQEMRPHGSRGQPYGTSGVFGAPCEEDGYGGSVETNEVMPRSSRQCSKQGAAALSPQPLGGGPGCPAAQVAVAASFPQGEGDAAGGAANRIGSVGAQKEAGSIAGSFCGAIAGAGALEDDTGQPSSLAASYLSRELKELQDVHRFGGGPLVRKRMQHAFRTGAFYDGQWLGNQRDGLGTQTWPDGAKYEGEWRDNKATGRGRFTHGDGDAYIGEWRNNLAHGHGIYNHREGTTYQGEFQNDLQHGLGVETWPDEAKFVGLFVHGKKTGRGVYQWPDRSQYAGQWVDNLINGLGTYTGADSRHFAGRWEASSMHGCGRYTWVDGRRYDGQYQRDQKDGFGIFLWADGRRYEGYWSQGQQDGLGRLRSAAGEVRLARWHNGVRSHWIESDQETAKDTAGSATGVPPDWPPPEEQDASGFHPSDLGSAANGALATQAGAGSGTGATRKADF